MSDLPFQNRLVVPIDWQGQPTKVTMMTGSSMMSGSLGIKGYREVATLTWVLPQTEAHQLVDQLKADRFNGIYDYACKVRGTIKVRPTDAYAYPEVYGNQYMRVSVAFEAL